MILYVIIISVGIAIAMALGLGIGIPINITTDGEVLLTILITFIALLAIDAIVAAIVHALPRKWFNPFKKIYKVFDWERKFYTKIGIKKWKDMIPETGAALTGFGKDKVIDLKTKEYVMKFMEETVYAEVLHFLSFIVSFVVIFINLKLAWLVGIPMILCNGVLQIMPVMTQRYNRPKLMVLYKRNQRRESKE